MYIFEPQRFGDIIFAIYGTNGLRTKVHVLSVSLQSTDSASVLSVHCIRMHCSEACAELLYCMLSCCERFLLMLLIIILT